MLDDVEYLDVPYVPYEPYVSSTNDVGGGLRFADALGAAADIPDIPAAASSSSSSSAKPPAPPVPGASSEAIACMYITQEHFVLCLAISRTSKWRDGRAYVSVYDV